MEEANNPCSVVPCLMAVKYIQHSRKVAIGTIYKRSCLEIRSCVGASYFLGFAVGGSFPNRSAWCAWTHQLMPSIRALKRKNVTYLTRYSLKASAWDVWCGWIPCFLSLTCGSKLFNRTATSLIVQQLIAPDGQSSRYIFKLLESVGKTTASKTWKRLCLLK